MMPRLAIVVGNRAELGNIEEFQWTLFALLGFRSLLTGRGLACGSSML